MAFQPSKQDVITRNNYIHGLQLLWMQVECNINWMRDISYISSVKRLGIMFKQCQSMQFNQRSTLPFLEHAGELCIIALRKKGNPYETPHTQKEAKNHLCTKKRKWYDRNLNNTQTLQRRLGKKVKNTFSPSQTP
jgi:hypothetical protein